MRNHPIILLLVLAVGLSSPGAQEQLLPPPTPTVAPRPTPALRTIPAPSVLVNPSDALALYNSGQLPAALAQTRREIAIDPNNMDARAIQTWTLVAMQRYPEAERVAEESLRLTPTDARFVEILGEACFYQNNLDKALSQFAQYVQIAPRGARIGRVYSFMGDAFLAKNAVAQAEFAYTAATITLPNSVVLWMKVGETRLRLKNDEMARTAFQRVLQLSPTNEQAAQYVKNL